MMPRASKLDASDTETQYAEAPVDPAVDGWAVYLSEIGGVGRLTAEEECALGRRSAAGDDDAVRTLVEANLRLVVTIAKRYRREGVALADLVQEGNIGLLQAAQRFDYRTGYRFSTYAVYWIRQAMSRALAAQAQVIRIPVNVQQELGRVARTQGEQQDASADTAVSPSSTPHLESLELARRARQTTSLDQRLGDDAETALGDLVADTATPSPFEATATRLLNDRLHEVLAGLPPRERTILGLRYGLLDGWMYSSVEVAQRLGLSAERIRHLEARTLAQLRYGAEGQELAAFRAGHGGGRDDDGQRHPPASHRAAWRPVDKRQWTVQEAP